MGKVRHKKQFLTSKSACVLLDKHEASKLVYGLLKLLSLAFSIRWDIELWFLWLLFFMNALFISSLILTCNTLVTLIEATYAFYIGFFLSGLDFVQIHRLFLIRNIATTVISKCGISLLQELITGVYPIWWMALVHNGEAFLQRVFVALWIRASFVISTKSLLVNCWFETMAVLEELTFTGLFLLFDVSHDLFLL